MAATFLLLAAGGLVTSAEAGLAVEDWPRSFGYNMFLYPFSRMTGGIYFEHAHRLLGALCGLTTLVMAVVLGRAGRRPVIRRIAWLAVLAVILQGILGGLRVTERSLPLAMVHGVLAQLFLSALVVLAAMTSPRWRSAEPPHPRVGAATDRGLGLLLVGVLVFQLVLGAAQRHFQTSLLLLAHVVHGIAIVVPLCLHVGIRAWGLNPAQRLLRRLGLALVAAVLGQLLLGFGAWVATGPAGAAMPGPGVAWAIATAHQWFGAFVLALVVTLVSWNFRLVRPA